MYNVYLKFVGEEPKTVPELQFKHGIHKMYSSDELKKAIEHICLAYKVDEKNGRLGDYYYWCVYEQGG